MDSIPWYAWIAIAGIVAYLLTSLGTTFAGSRKKDRDALSDALRANTEAQAQTVAKLDAIERRLAAVEKTLTDIP